MRAYWGRTWVVCWIAGMLLAGCSGGDAPTAIPDLDLAYTQAAQTIVAELTLNAPPPVTESPPEAGEGLNMQTSPVEETLPATSTPLPTETPMPTQALQPAVTLVPAEVPAPVASAAPLEPSFTLSYADDFSFATGWPVINDDQTVMYYSKGGYVMQNNVINDAVWSTRSTQYVNTQLEVTGNRIAGSLDGYYGVICRFADGSNYYALVVSSDGSYGIAKQKAGILTFLVEGRDESGTIYTGNAPNVIRADCIGKKLSLYVNGVFLASIEDGDFTAGAVGLAVGTRRKPGYEAFFDDFKVYIPE